LPAAFGQVKRSAPPQCRGEPHHLLWLGNAPPIG
jgi:hypothetical protein